MNRWSKPVGALVLLATLSGLALPCANAGKGNFRQLAIAIINYEPSVGPLDLPDDLKDETSGWRVEGERTAEGEWSEPSLVEGLPLEELVWDLLLNANELTDEEQQFLLDLIEMNELDKESLLP